MPLSKIYNEQGSLVGITDRVPATVYVEDDSNPDPAKRKYWLVDGNGVKVLNAKDEIAALEVENKANEARKAELLKLAEDQKALDAAAKKDTDEKAKTAATATN